MSFNVSELSVNVEALPWHIGWSQAQRFTKRSAVTLETINL